MDNERNPATVYLFLFDSNSLLSNTFTLHYLDGHATRAYIYHNPGLYSFGPSGLMTPCAFTVTFKRSY